MKLVNHLIAQRARFLLETEDLLGHLDRLSRSVERLTWCIGALTVVHIGTQLF
jgi:hypothetical protein